MEEMDLNQIIEVLQQLLQEVEQTRKKIEQILNNQFYAEPA
jgi:hypothetical protein